MVKILLVDDSAVLVQSLKIILEQEPEFRVVGAARNGAEAAETCTRLSPDIVLMDVRMPECNGVEGTRLIKQRHPGVKVLVLTTFDDRDYIEAAIRNGADGYLLKDIGEDDLIAAVKSTVNGFSVIQGSVFQALKDRFKPPLGKPPAAGDKPLTTREREITSLVVDGLSNKEIAARLGISEGTARNAISSILAKLGLADRTQLAVYAIKNNLIN